MANSNLPEFIFDLVNGPILTLVSGSVSSSLYLSPNGHLGFGPGNSASVDSSDTASFSLTASYLVGEASCSAYSDTASYVDSSDVDIFGVGKAGTGVGGLIFNSHFLSATTALISDLATTVSGTSAAGSLGVGEVSHPGIAVLATGTTATGRACLNSYTSCVLFGSGSYIFESMVRLPLTSSATNRYTASIGFGNNSGAGDMTNGAYFVYTDAASPYWIARTAGGSLRTSVVSTVPIVSGGWYKLRVVVRDVATASFYVNDSLIANISTNLPKTLSMETGIVHKVEKTLGTGSSIMHVDYTKVAYL